MSTIQITDDAVGKAVVDAHGDQFGIVSAVEHGTARVDPDPGITDKIKAKLGWEETDEDTYPLQENAIQEVTDDQITVRFDL